MILAPPAPPAAFVAPVAPFEAELLCVETASVESVAAADLRFWGAAVLRLMRRAKVVSEKRIVAG